MTYSCQFGEAEAEETTQEEQCVSIAVAADALQWCGFFDLQPKGCCMMIVVKNIGQRLRKVERWKTFGSSLTVPADSMFKPWRACFHLKEVEDNLQANVNTVMKNSKESRIEYRILFNLFTF